jgi:hypothetical protein
MQKFSEAFVDLCQSAETTATGPFSSLQRRANLVAIRGNADIRGVRSKGGRHSSGNVMACSPDGVNPVITRKSSAIPPLPRHVASSTLLLWLVRANITDPHFIAPLYSQLINADVISSPPPIESFSALFTLWLSVIATVGLPVRLAGGTPYKVRDGCDRAFRRSSTNRDSRKASAAARRGQRPAFSASRRTWARGEEASVTAEAQITLDSGSSPSSTCWRSASREALPPDRRRARAAGARVEHHSGASRRSRPRPAILLRDVVTNGQAQPSPFTGGLRREEGMEQPLLHLGRYAVPLSRILISTLLPRFLVAAASVGS